MNNFWRIAPQVDSHIQDMIELSILKSPAEIIPKLRPRHGIILAEWDESNLLGRARLFGVVTAVNIPESLAKVTWVPSDVTLKPNPAGRQYWRNKHFFKFAKDVSIRYMLDDLFTEHFPQIEDMAFESMTGGGGAARSKTYQETPGYIYVIKSQHGYKIGKTVNLKTRLNLFEVKLPFPIALSHYAWFENYSKAERDFHLMFSDKRLEGEWFDLTDRDLEEIKRHGQSVPIEGL